VRREAPRVRVVRTKVGVSGLRAPLQTGVLLSVGLCGGLDTAAVSGIVVIPTEVALGDQRWQCDAEWSGALAAAAARLGAGVLRAPLKTSRVMVTGAAREGWARQGFAAVDMETAQLFEYAPRVAAVRVVLDSPARELSPRWRRPALAMLDPRRWAEAWWLARYAPRYARLAARVLASALADRDVQSQI
jgi:hypothetical protein